MASAWRNRVWTIGVVGVFLLATGLLYPDPKQRGPVQYLIVITLGYGHLIGAAVFAKPRMARFVPAGVPLWLVAAFAVTSVATLFACYASLVARSPGVLAPLLAVSLWHIVENDRALAHTDGGRRGLEAPSRRRGEQAVVLVITAALLAFGDALLTPAEYGPAFDGTLLSSLRGAAGLDLSGIRWLGFGDFFTAVTLYHLVGFLVFFAQRVAVSRERGLPTAQLWSRLFWVHVPPALLCAALLLGRDPRADALRTVVFSPGIYLFWSVLHVAQTSLVRRQASAERAPRAAVASA